MKTFYLEIVCVKECPEVPDVLLPPSHPLLDIRLGDGQAHLHLAGAGTTNWLLSWLLTFYTKIFFRF